MAAATHAAPGRIAVALGEMGPGGLNMASGLGVALNNNLPLQCTSVCLAFETRTCESPVARLRLQPKSLWRTSGAVCRRGTSSNRTAGALKRGLYGGAEGRETLRIVDPAATIPREADMA
ncbi:hypothetical protein LJR062_004289 [Variovorax paradoxus]